MKVKERRVCRNNKSCQNLIVGVVLNKYNTVEHDTNCVRRATDRDEKLINYKE